MSELTVCCLKLPENEVEFKMDVHVITFQMDKCACVELLPMSATEIS